MSDSPTRAPAKRRRIFKLIALSVSLLLSVVVAEVFLTILYRDARPEELTPLITTMASKFKMYKYHDKIGYVLQPGYSDDKRDLHVNSQGFRSNLEYELGENRTRQSVLILGDSMAFGYGVRQDRLFTKLLNDEHRSIHFINAGVPGYSTLREYLFVREYLERINPDAVILFYTQANDMWHNPGSSYFNPPVDISDGTIVTGTPSPVHEYPWYQKLMVYRVLDTKFLKGRDPPHLYNKLNFWALGGNSSLWKLSTRLLEGIDKEMQKKNMPMLVYDIPTIRQVQGGLVDERQRLLADLCKRLGWDYVDLLPAYPEPRKELFLEGDSHWNEKGHRFIADHIKTRLSRLGIRDTIEEPRVPKASR